MKQNPTNMIGQAISGRYEISGILGTGGNGTVYEAMDVVFQRRVAVKIPQSNRTENLLQFRRFAREARACAAIAHPNVAITYDAGKLSNGTPYLVMEKLAGESLYTRLRRGRLPIPEAFSVILQVLAALSAAHARRIVHRDLKPANIFLAQTEGYRLLAKVLDFGMCKNLDGDEEDDTMLTKPGVVLGTPAYMAPEQAAALGTIDERVDVFATGAILYEALTGKRAFPASSAIEAIRQTLQARPMPMTAHLPEIPRELDELVARALAREPDRRFPTASDFAVALQALRTTPTLSPLRAEQGPPDEKLAQLRARFREVAEQHRAVGPTDPAQAPETIAMPSEEPPSVSNLPNIAESGPSTTT